MVTYVKSEAMKEFVIVISWIWAKDSQRQVNPHNNHGNQNNSVFLAAILLVLWSTHSGHVRGEATMIFELTGQGLGTNHPSSPPDRGTHRSSERKQSQDCIENCH